MSKKNSFIRTLFPLTLAVGLAFSATAQVLNSPKAKAPAETPAPEPANSDPNYTQITRVYESWSLQCQERSGDGRCFVETVVRQNKPQVRDVVSLRLFQAGEGVRATIVSPNRVKLSRGVTLRVSDKSFTADYAICGPVNCNASLDAGNDLVELLRSQSDLAVSFYMFASAKDGGEREIKIPVSLAGFSTAYDSLVVFDAEK